MYHFVTKPSDHIRLVNGGVWEDGEQNMILIMREDVISKKGGYSLNIG